MLRKTPGSQEVAATPQRAIHVNMWKAETSSQGVAPVIDPSESWINMTYEFPPNGNFYY